MKRINLNVDLEENEIFDKEITDVIKSKVRETVRNERNDFIRKEVEHELKRLMESKEWGYKDRLKSMIKDCVWDAVKEIVSFSLEDIRILTNEKVEERLDYVVNQAVEKTEKLCKDTIKATISDKVAEKLKNLLSTE